MSCGTAFVTYRELLEHGERIASALRAAGIGEGDRVAILTGKCLDALAAMVGALLVGAVYVPIDPDQPETRIRLILDDCGCAAMVTTSRRSWDPAEAASRSPAVIVADRLAGLQRLRGAVRRDPNDTAFILYTSGSTGTPKGVCISHRNLLHFIHWCLSELDVRERDTFANHAPFSFDISTFDIYVAAAARAGLRILSPEAARHPAVMIEEITRHRISVWYSVPSALRLILRGLASAAAQPSSLRYVLFAGEVFPIAELQRLMRQWPNAAFYNLYGPTETNVCTYYRVQQTDSKRESPVPIGQPLPGLRAYLTDAQGHELAADGPGELIIEGPCVTSGYWGNPDSRNRENHRRGRHATGDLVEWAGGQLVFRGRIDHMIKVDGYRVEIGEIESVLSSHPEIDDVVVVAAPNSDRTRLTACYVGAPTVSLVALKTFCAARLPSYMIPHHLLRLDHMPRTANGKVDRLRIAGLAAKGS